MKIFLDQEFRIQESEFRFLKLNHREYPKLNGKAHLTWQAEKYKYKE
jgi:hypothetical protein